MVIRNKTETEKIYQGRPIASLGSFTITRSLENEYENDADLIADITSGDATLEVAGEEITDPVIAANCLRRDYPYSIALDKDGTDQEISGTDWIEVEASRALWDLSSNYTIETNDLTVPFNGIYSFDVQLRLDTLVNVTEVELAIFKRENPDDDYWFIISRRVELDGYTEINLNGATLFDFYTDEQYVLKIKLTGSSPSATIDGSDDYSAWGYNYLRLLE